MTESVADGSRLAGISDLDLVLAFHFSPLWMNGAALRVMNSTDAILVDKVLMMTHLDLQKTFPDNHVCPKCLAALLCGSAVREKSQHPFGCWVWWELHWSTGNVGISTAY